MTKLNETTGEEIKLLQKRIVVLEKINARYKELEEKLHEARGYAENIVETVREPLLIMDGNLKVISANGAFYQTFRVNPKETQGEFVYNLGNGQWDIPELKRLLREIITKKNTFDNYEIRHKFESIGEKIMLLNARRIPPTPAKPKIILLAIEDITENVIMKRDVATRLEEQVKVRTKQLDEINEKLQEKIADLEIFNKVSVGREIKMIELKKEIESLKQRISTTENVPK